MLVVIILSLTFSLVHLQSSEDVVVETTKGLIRGKHVNIGSDTSQLFYGEADIFLGIPYAKPPVGELRFKKPEDIDPYNVAWDATKFRPRCLQNDDPLNPFPKSMNMSEDCLYLNVFTRQASKSARHPVMIFISGSNSFSTGGSDPRHMKGTIRNFVMKDIVVVTIQYRLGALGFFTNYNTEFPPNLGMLDQVKALEWAKNEISNFGGDPDEITLCGQSSGACSVNAHTLSPVSQKLFKRAIIQSGSIQGCFSITPEGGILEIHTSDGVDKTINLDSSYFRTVNQSNGRYPETDNSLSDNQQQAQYNSTQQPNQIYYDTSTNAPYPTSQQQLSTNMNPSNSPTQSTNPSTETVNTTEAPPLTGVNINTTNPSEQFAAQACNMTAEEWRKGQIQKLQSCLHNLTFDVYLKVDGTRTSAWMIVRDNYFLPDTLENLAKKRPNIPIIIGTVQDEDASYAFKLVANGNATQNQGEVYNNWFADFAKKQGVNGEEADKMRNIIAQSYDIPTNPPTSTPFQTSQQNPQTQFYGTTEPILNESTPSPETTTPPIRTLNYQEFGTTHAYANTTSEYASGTANSWPDYSNPIYPTNSQSTLSQSNEPSSATMSTPYNQNENSYFIGTNTWQTQQPQNMGRQPQSTQTSYATYLPTSTPQYGQPTEYTFGQQSTGTFSEHTQTTRPSQQSNEPLSYTSSYNPEETTAYPDQRQTNPTLQYSTTAFAQSQESFIYNQPTSGSTVQPNYFQQSNPPTSENQYQQTGSYNPQSTPLSYSQPSYSPTSENQYQQTVSFSPQSTSQIYSQPSYSATSENQYPQTGFYNPQSTPQSSSYGAYETTSGFHTNMQHTSPSPNIFSQNAPFTAEQRFSTTSNQNTSPHNQQQNIWTSESYTASPQNTDGQPTYNYHYPSVNQEQTTYRQELPSVTQESEMPYYSPSSETTTPYSPITNPWQQTGTYSSNQNTQYLNSQAAQTETEEPHNNPTGNYNYYTSTPANTWQTTGNYYYNDQNIPYTNPQIQTTVTLEIIPNQPTNVYPYSTLEPQQSPYSQTGSSLNYTFYQPTERPSAENFSGYSQQSTYNYQQFPESTTSPQQTYSQLGNPATSQYPTNHPNLNTVPSYQPSPIQYPSTQPYLSPNGYSPYQQASGYPHTSSDGYTPSDNFRTTQSATTQTPHNPTNQQQGYNQGTSLPTGYPGQQPSTQNDYHYQQTQQPQQSYPNQSTPGGFITSPSNNHQSTLPAQPSSIPQQSPNQSPIYYNPLPQQQNYPGSFQQHYVIQFEFPCQLDPPCSPNNVNVQNNQQPQPVVNQPAQSYYNAPANSNSYNQNYQSFQPNQQRYNNYAPNYSAQNAATEPTNRQYDDQTAASNVRQSGPPPSQTYQNASIPPNADRNSVIDTLKMITKVSSDACVVKDVSKELDSLLSQGNNNVRVFEFVHVTQIGSDRIPNVLPWQPVYQGVDVLFLWMDEEAWSDPSKITPTDIQVANDMSRRWADFVKTGSVSDWQPTTQQNHQYCQLSNNPQMKENYGQTASHVFNELIPRALNPTYTQQSTTLVDERVARQRNNAQPAEMSWSISLSLPDLIINF